MTKLARYILEHLAAAHPYSLPEAALFSDVRVLVRPVADEAQCTDAIYHLLQKDLIRFERDIINDEKKYVIKEAGRNALRDA